MIQAVIYNLHFYRWITWDVQKTWTDPHGVSLYLQNCSNSAASDGAISNVANLSHAVTCFFYLQGEVLVYYGGRLLFFID